VNVCALTHRDALRSAGTDLDRLLADWAGMNPTLERRLKRSRRMSDWMAVGPVHIGPRHLHGEKRLFVGDAAYVVDPFMGEGIAMGLRSGLLAAQAFRQSDVAAAYDRAWHRHFDSALRWGPRLRSVMQRPVTQNAAVAGLALFPKVLDRLTALTRP
jgi:flavin-dependent dehydrogenase